jgi:hypothetical protein
MVAKTTSITASYLSYTGLVTLMHFVPFGDYVGLKSGTILTSEYFSILFMSFVAGIVHVIFYTLEIVSYRTAPP